LAKSTNVRLNPVSQRCSNVHRVSRGIDGIDGSRGEIDRGGHIRHAQHIVCNIHGNVIRYALLQWNLGKHNATEQKKSGKKTNPIHGEMGETNDSPKG
jgi:hypothetical protein